MSTATASTPSKAKAKKEKEKQLSQSQENERLKAVVRRLPPNLPEDVFWQSVQSWVTEETTTWQAFSPGKLRKRLNKENIPSRAYIAFKTEEQVALFSREYDGHIFRDKNGVESQAVIEFAPYQKIPPEKRKVDGRNGTIEKDEDYISFLESLKASETAEPVSLETLIASTQPAPHPKTTPLLEALKAEKTAVKDKEAITRNHAHYKQVEVATHKEDRKKSTAATATVRSEAQVANPSLAGGKKAAKKVQAQAQAAASKASMPNKNVSTNVPLATHQTSPAGAPSSSSRPPKPPKALRPVQQGKPTSSASTSGATATHIASTSSVASIDRAASASAPQPDNSSSAPSRRTRPIIGIASRQFEAALSIAGLANSASERRKREKEKPKDVQTPTTESGGAVSNASSKDGKDVHSDSHNHSPLKVTVDTPDPDKGKAAASLPPPSPKKDKSRRSAAGRVVHPPSLNTASTTPVIVPRILQRDGGPSPAAPVNNTLKAAPLSSGAVSPPSPVANNPPGGQPRGGRRGRGGGGRGRGGPPRGGS